MLTWLIAAALAQTTSSTTLQRNTSKIPEKITVTGCVERADQVASPAATLGTTVESLTSVLRTTPPSETAGTSGTRPATDKGYRLDGERRLRLVGGRAEGEGGIDQDAFGDVRPVAGSDYSICQS